jgi:hypothetical protein
MLMCSYIENKLPNWVKNIEIHLDNAGINKSFLLVAGLSETVVCGRFRSVKLVYLIAGHAKVFK